MAAATVVQNNAPSPHSSSSAGSSPQAQPSRLAASSNAPVYTQEDVVRFIQAALAAACRDHALHHQGQTRMQQDARLVQEERIMKPRVHMYEAFGERRRMITTLELPGLQKSDVSITARPNGDLIISGERRPQHLLYLHTLHETDGKSHSDRDREDEEPGRTVFNELKFGRFQRVIRLPNGTDVSFFTSFPSWSLLIMPFHSQLLLPLLWTTACSRFVGHYHQQVLPQSTMPSTKPTVTTFSWTISEQSAIARSGVHRIYTLKLQL